MWDRSTPLEETMRALDDAVRAGKVLYVGISDAPAGVVARAATLAEWRGWSPFIGLQVPYSLVQRDAERELLPMAEALGLAVTAWSPLGGGVLSGKYTVDGDAGATRLDRANVDERTHAVVRAVLAVADEVGATPAQIALAWTRRRAGVFPILGARRLSQLEDNLGALTVELSADQCARLEAATGFELGFPGDFIAQNARWVFGSALV
jgi:aryl-alcohol dehydrogenase-like predicted oxidoreductase